VMPRECLLETEITADHDPIDLTVGSCLRSNAEQVLMAPPGLDGVVKPVR
jgi:hypothetical protein